MSNVLTTGWAEVISSQSIGGSAVFREQATGQEASVSLTSAASQRVSFPFENGPGLALGIALANIDAAQAATVSVIVRNEQGQVISTEAPVGVPRHGHTSFVVPVRSSRLEDQRGVVELSSSGSTGLISLGIRSAQGAFTSSEPLSATTQASQFISHIADGGQWQTDVVLVNLDSVPATFTLNAWGDNGVALLLPISGRGNISTFTETIPVGGSRTIRTAGTSGVLTTGWAEVLTSQSIGGTAVFRMQNTGQEASVSLTSAATRRMLFSFENGPGLALGIALANPNPTQGALVSVTLRNEQGQLISTEQPIQLQVDGHSAFVIPMRSSGPEDRRGVVELYSPDSAIVGLGIRGNGKAFTSVHGTK